jgi:O-antigen/teichoic acid export membrane protein
MNLIIQATISRLHTMKEKEKLQAMLTRVTRWIMAFTIPAYAFIVVFSKQILSFFGPGFSEGQTALIIICSAQLVNVAFGPVGVLSLMSGNERYNIIFSGIKVVLGIALNLLLIPSLGVVGTAIATAACIVVTNVGLYITINKKTGLRPWIFG